MILIIAGVVIMSLLALIIVMALCSGSREDRLVAILFALGLALVIALLAPDATKDWRENSTDKPWAPRMPTSWCRRGAWTTCWRR